MASCFTFSTSSWFRVSTPCSSRVPQNGRQGKTRAMAAGSGTLAARDGAGNQAGSEERPMDRICQNELLPHRPDAFFTLHFPGHPEGKQLLHFFYEAAGGTENTTRFCRK